MRRTCAAGEADESGLVGRGRIGQAVLGDGAEDDAAAAAAAAAASAAHRRRHRRRRGTAHR